MALIRSTLRASLRFLATAAFAVVSSSATAALINFEDTQTGVLTVVGDRYLSQGLRVSGAGPFSGVVYSEGMFGVQNFGNSSTQVMDLGGRNQPTILSFVDPNNPSQALGATFVTFLAGDGDLQSETFTVSFFDVFDNLLSSTTYTTLTSGIAISATSSSLGALIGRVRLELDGQSESGAVIDDLNFSQNTSTAVSEPSSLILALLGSALAMRSLRLRRW